MHEQVEFLAPEYVRCFLSRLAGLPPDEARKCKVLFIRNAISVFRAVTAAYERIGRQRQCQQQLAALFGVLAREAVFDNDAAAVGIDPDDVVELRRGQIYSGLCSGERSARPTNGVSSVSITTSGNEQCRSCATPSGSAQSEPTAMRFGDRSFDPSACQVATHHD